MAAPIVAAAAKWAASRAVGGVVPTKKSGGSGKWAASGGAVVVIGGILIMGMFLGLMSSLVGILGGAASSSAVGAAGAVAVSCTTLESGPSDVALSDIPAVALDAYLKAGKTTGVDWSYIAAIGKIESNHGRTGGRHLDAKGDVQDTPIQGPPTRYGRAVGPMQFLTSTWKSVGKDGNYDGKKDAQNIFDAALGTGNYLKIEGAPGDMRKAIFAYNHADWYVDQVIDQAKQYRTAEQAMSTAGGATAPINGNVTVAHANPSDTASTAAFEKTMRAIVAKKPDFITLNEQDVRSLASIEAAAPGYTAWRNQTSTGDKNSIANVILWKESVYRVLDKGSTQIVKDDVVASGGREYTSDKFAAWVLLERPADEAIMSVVATQMPVSPEKYGPNQLRRQQLYALGIDRITRLAGALGAHGPVFIGGDMNTNRSDAYSWSAVTKMTNAQFGYHTSGTDFVFYQKTLGIQMSTTGAGSTSDPKRKWIYATFAMNGATAPSGGPATATDVASAVGPLAHDDTTGPSKSDINKVTSQRGSTTATAPGWTMPMKPDTYTLSAHWGQTGSLWSSGYHTGQDFAAPVGTPVYAAAAGTVIPRTDQGWAGPNFLTIDHGVIDGKHVVTWYAHLSSKAVNGGTVTAGQYIGNVGALGNVTGAHLHFEVRVDGKDVDPTTWLAGAGVPNGSVASDGCGPNGSSGVVSGDGSWGGFQNGQIPLTSMCQVNFAAVYFECNAAKALDLLSAAYEARFKRKMTPIGGYRDLAGQVSCTSPLCAKPGTSMHGWGLAVDISNGKFGGPGASATGYYSRADYKWMDANAPKYGWVNPKWARQGGGREEPWHWEFVGTGNQAPEPYDVFDPPTP